MRILQVSEASAGRGASPQASQANERTPGASSGSGILAATIASAAMIAQQVAGKSTRDALFLAEFPVRALPGMMILAALVSFSAALLAARLLARHGPRDVVRGAFLLNAAAFGIEFVVSFFSRASIAVAVYVHLALFGATVISLFWSLINERWDPHAAKGAIARIAAGGTLGGVIGGLVGWRLSQLTSVRMMLFALAALNVVSLLAVVRVGGDPSRPSHPASSWPPVSPAVARGLPTLRAERYLLTLGAMVAIVATMDALLDYLFAAEASARLSSGRELMTFFSVFHTVVGIATFVAQATLSRRVLERFGLAVTLAVLPVAVVMLALIGLQTHALIAIVVLRGAGAVFANSLWRSGYELLYTPIAQSKKRSTKTLIDVGCDRLGTLLGSAAVLAVLATSDDARTRMLFLVVALGVIAIVAARGLHRGYVGALEESLRTGAVRSSTAEREVADATTRQALAPCGKDRVVLAREVAIEAPPPSSGSQQSGADILVAAVADLRSGNRLRIQRVLCAGADDPALASFVVPLLAREDTRAEALAWLRRVAPRIEGQLVDTLRDRNLDPAARRRVPRLLRALATQTAADGLARALCDERFDVRYECGAALARLAQREPTISIPSRAILDAVRLELAVERKLLEAEPVHDLEDEPEAPIFEGQLRDRATRGLEHVFTILSLMLDREALRIAWRALQSEDQVLRGTALEYLENVLPSEIRDALWPYLEAAPRPVPVRARGDELIIMSFPPPRPSLA